ncbi:MAG: HIT family protein [Candidatus Sungbacteria bacterium]|uniref:HIT family protein n=1 Tax=Candidatus Sungiibacteriota bacterium TaxID=2750080 RepID=A0A931SAX8_9BACT|nr:HIT family protein [Candidatus Sungbacteria bacterium]
MPDESFSKFGYPEALVKEYSNWIVLCASKQATLATLLLVCKDKVTAFSKISEASFAELPKVLREVENNLQKLFQNDKINYLMLMMANPEVHFAVFPRYAKERKFAGVTFLDKGWPSKPDTDFANEIDDRVFTELVSTLKTAFEGV